MSIMVTKPVFDYFYQHLVEFHSSKIKILNHFAYDFDEYMRMLKLSNLYISQCERFLGDVTTADGKDELPFVIFNSIIKLSSASDDWSCCIMLPKEEFEKSLLMADITPIPCNSPEAHALILKRCGESVVIEKDEKTCTYTIKSIEPNPYIPLVQNEKWYGHG